MSMILALRCQGGILMAADSIGTASDVVVEPQRKLVNNGGVWCGSVGGSAQIYEFGRKLAMNPDAWDDPDWHLEQATAMCERAAKMRERGNTQMEDRSYPTTLMVQGSRIMIANQDGYLWPQGDFSAIGPGDAVAYSLLNQMYSPDLTREEMEKLAEMVITAVARATIYVRPPVNTVFIEG